MKQTLVLVGAYAGQTVELALGMTKFQFTEGKIELEGSDKDVAALAHALALNFQAFPEGSPELEVRQKEVADANEVHADGKVSDGEANLQGGAGATTGGKAPDDGGADDAAKAGTAGAGDATGDGSRSIAEALKQLDPADDSLWTADGKPKMSALEALLGRTDITRAMVEAAAPGFVRPDVK